jgi:uncharacterized protein YdeI (YjbR/CyaY-like superfamily)
MANHESPDELWIGFYKKASGKPSITYREALDECLCFGWIDGVRHAVDGERYRQRFTQRRPRSNWSAVNVKRAEELKAAGKMEPPGLAAFEARDPDGQRYSYENRPAGLSEEYEAQLKQRPKAWEYFQAQPPWYRRNAAFFVMDAKREETRQRRLQSLIEGCENGLWVAPLRRAQG